MAYQSKFHGRAGSRSSLSSVGQMPVISEHGHSPMPSPPLRIPQKQSRKNGGRGSITPPPPYAAFSVPNGSAMRPPPPAFIDPGFTGDPEKMMVNEMNGDPSQRDQQQLSQWHSESRDRKCRFVVTVSTVMIILVGLAVGLSLGLSKGGIGNGRDGTTRGGDSSDLSNFPIGSYSLETTVRRTSTGCTSDPTTWQCFPNSAKSAISFSWTIEQAPDHDGYQISSFPASSNSSAFPSFVDVPLTLLDSSLISERFVFSFQMNKVVVPVPDDKAESSTHRAAKCTFSNTTFQAILWTRLSRVRPHHESPRHARRQQQQEEEGGGGEAETLTWPGLVEITETSDSALGSLECEDAKENTISDVQNGAGTCDCTYRTLDNE